MKIYFNTKSDFLENNHLWRLYYIFPTLLLDIWLIFSLLRTFYISRSDKAISSLQLQELTIALIYVFIYLFMF